MNPRLPLFCPRSPFLTTLNSVALGAWVSRLCAGQQKSFCSSSCFPSLFSETDAGREGGLKEVLSEFQGGGC